MTLRTKLSEKLEEIFLQVFPKIRHLLKEIWQRLKVHATFFLSTAVYGPAYSTYQNERLYPVYQPWMDVGNFDQVWLLPRRHSDGRVGVVVSWSPGELAATFLALLDSSLSGKFVGKF